MRPMSGMDAAFLYMETPTTPMHVVGVLVLEPTAASGPFGLAAVTQALRERLHLIPPLRRRIVTPPGAIDHPLWIEDPDFDLANHIRVAPLPAPVGWSELEEYVGEVAGRLLDRRRPLWEMWIIEGLEGGRVGLVTKLHHSMMDGGAGGDLMASLFDLEPGAGPPVPPESPWAPDTLPWAPSHALHSVGSLVRRQREVPGAFYHAMGSLVGSARTWAMLRAAGSATQLTAPRTMVNGPLTARRTVSLTTVDLDQVREIRRAFHTTINDVVLAATATALRGYLSARGALPTSPLVAAAPVNARLDSADSGEFGNKVSNMMVGLPMEPSDPVRRLHAVHEAAQSSKAMQSAFGPETLQQLTGFASPMVMTALARVYSSLRIARLHRPVLNLIVSNVPGPPIDLYCAGARVTGIFPMGPLFEGSGLNLTVLSEAHHLNVGIMACPDLAPDVGDIGQRFVGAVAELHRLALEEKSSARLDP
jgi:WS/DGAT/MGAT family acyltransferase